MENALSDHKPGWQQRLLALLGATLIADAWGSVVQTQFNIAALQSIGAEIPFALRLRVTGLDLLGFTPIYGLIALTGLICALPVAHWLARRWPGGRGALFALGGGIGMATAIRFVDFATPAPTLIAATRSSAGLIAMALGGALAGWWFARRTSAR